MKDPQALLSQDALEETRPSNLNLYPRKRELEAQISAANEDLTKSKIELRNLASFLSNNIFTQVLHKIYQLLIYLL